MNIDSDNNSVRKRSEQSFTLIETIIALGLMVTVIMEIGNVQGNAVYFSSYERNATQAAWLAKGFMSQVEYEWNTRAFSELEFKVPERDIPEFDGFTYAINIEEWKLPLMDLLTGGGGGGDEGGESAPEADIIRSQVKNILGDDLLKIAQVEVFWAEGARKESVSVAMLLTNQKGLDEKIALLQAPSTPSGGGNSSAGGGNPPGSGAGASSPGKSGGNPLGGSSQGGDK
ncbi:MAG: hypothetical protein R3B45_01415 [Bdellovibrionota bacterium]